MGRWERYPRIPRWRRELPLAISAIGVAGFLMLLALLALR